MSAARRTTSEPPTGTPAREDRAGLEIGARLRLLEAMLLDPLAPSGLAVDAWLTAMTSSPDGEAFDFGLAITADERRSTWHVGGDGATVAGELSRFARDHGAPADELARLEQATARLRPARLGAWLEASPDAVDVGWLVSEPVALADAWSFIDDCEALAALRAWTAAHRIETIESLSRSMGAGFQVAGLLVPLPGDDVRAAIEVGCAGLDAIGVPDLPPEALRGLLAMARPPLALTVWLTREGVARAGFSAPSPTTALALMQCAQAGRTDRDALALLEATAGGTGPHRLDCARTARGFEIALHYRITA